MSKRNGKNELHIPYENYLARIVLHRNMTLATKASVGNVYSWGDVQLNRGRLKYLQRIKAKEINKMYHPDAVVQFNFQIKKHGIDKEIHIQRSGLFAKKTEGDIYS